MKPILVESFLTPAEAQALLASVLSLPWTRGRFMGRAVPREEVWMGPYAYKFSGRTLVPAPWTPETEALRVKIGDHYGGDYNSVLLNRYANEQDSVSWHSDDEPEMDSDHPIASLSLGAARELLVRPITRRTPCNHTSLLPGAFSSCRPDFNRDTSTASRNRARLALLE
jgi:alkylated DNA repair dioxygenase AlkB